jgi:hypothetical protein
MGIRRLGPYGKKMPLMGLCRTLEFHKEDGTKTEWRMIECIWGPCFRWSHVSRGIVLYSLLLSNTVASLFDCD